MAIVNKILNIIILIIAIAAVLFSFLLFRTRTAFREYGDKYAEQTAKIVKILETDSGDKYSRNLHVEDFETDDGKSHRLGTLGWPNYWIDYKPGLGSEKFDKSMREYEELSKKLHGQRNDLAAAIDGYIHELEKGIDLGQASDIKEESFQLFDDYKDSIGVVQEWMGEVQTRDNDLMVLIYGNANKIGHPLEDGILKDLENYEDALRHHKDNIFLVNQRMRLFVNGLAQAINTIDKHTFEADRAKLEDETDYMTEMNKIENDFSAINEKLKDLEKTKIELVDVEHQLKNVRGDLASAGDQNSRLQEQAANLKRDKRVLEDKLAKVLGESDPKRRDPESFDFNVPINLLAKVVTVDYDWNYIIINRGAEDKLRKDMVLLVRREQEFICKVRLTTVEGRFSVADIMPEFQQGIVLKGDSVIPAENL